LLMLLIAIGSLIVVCLAYVSNVSTFSALGEEVDLGGASEVCLIPEASSYGDNLCSDGNDCTSDLLCGYARNYSTLLLLASISNGSDDTASLSYASLGNFFWCQRRDSLVGKYCNDVCVRSGSGSCKLGGCSGLCVGDCGTFEGNSPGNYTILTCESILFVDQVQNLVNNSNGTTIANYTRDCFFGSCIHVLTLQENTSLGEFCRGLDDVGSSFSSFPTDTTSVVPFGNQGGGSSISYQDLGASVCLDVVNDDFFFEKLPFCDSTL